MSQTWFQSTNARVAGFAVAAALQIVGTLLIPGYSAPFAIRALLVIASLLAVASIGQTLVVILGGIDLSIPFIIGFANVVAAQLYGAGWNFALVCVIVGVLAVLIGALNGLISRGLDIHPLIVTLGVGMIVQRRRAVVDRRLSIRIGACSCFRLRLDRRFGRTAAGAGAGALRRGADLAGGAGAGAHGLRPPPLRAWQQPRCSPAGADRSGPHVDGDLRGKRFLCCRGWRAAARLHRFGLWRCRPALSVPDHRGGRGRGAALVGGRGNYFGTIAGVLVLTEINTLLIGLGFRPSTMQAALGLVIVLLVSLYGRERHVSATI